MARARRYGDLRANAVNFWPGELAAKEQEASIIPRLIETQDKFISILHVADASPESWKDVLGTTTDFAANLFLKHLMVLTDVGGEPLKRFKAELPGAFEGGTMRYVWHDAERVYRFQTLNRRAGWGNNDLLVDGKGLLAPAGLSPAMEDVAMLLLFGGSALNAGLPAVIQEKCVVGTLIGHKQQLDTFVRRRYIWVSRITGGATANKLGNLAQGFVRERLQQLLPEWDFSKGTIDGISQNAGRTDMSFDMVAESPRGRCCAIEVSFQVTTNSVIERKAGQAKSRRDLLHRNGHCIAYVIDGAGNFERSSALNTICRYSDCTVTFADSELQCLAGFLRKMDEDQAAGE